MVGLEGVDQAVGEAERPAGWPRVLEEPLPFPFLVAAQSLPKGPSHAPHPDPLPVPNEQPGYPLLRLELECQEEVCSGHLVFLVRQSFVQCDAEPERFLAPLYVRGVCAKVTRPSLSLTAPQLSHGSKKGGAPDPGVALRHPPPSNTSSCTRCFGVREGGSHSGSGETLATTYSSWDLKG